MTTARARCVRLGVACGRGSRTTPSRPPRNRRAAAEAHTETDPNTVKVEAGMLRDLRVTTAAVESRPGGEQITLLGELAVDQRTYAEVGVPVAARVTRLLVECRRFRAPGPDAGGADEPGTRAGRAPTICPPKRASGSPMRRSSANVGWRRRRSFRSARFKRRSHRPQKLARRCDRRGPPSARSVSQPPTEDADGPASSAFVLAVPGQRSGHRADCGRRPDAGSGGASVSYRRPLDALVDGACLRARRRPDREGRGRQAGISGPSGAGLPRERLPSSAGTSSASLERCRCGLTCGMSGNVLRPGMSATRRASGRRVRRTDSHRAGRGGATRPQRMVRLPAQGREHI